ncbi:transcription activator of gluconeogenesis [Pleomassaria siparia CBS 279.74]|uniref:Transcription activator of gluconeogenesis n=1 Tax=Pleomassaria siparia CBS 279.74 TaxID=1314801 RepID=A0A6G1KLN2_9PLEO|nr:transcription activator of gluconeogenesis [Pleomassaria siparia CBS 279.74]
MSTPDAEDASPSPEYRSDPDDDMAVEQKSEPRDGDASPSLKTVNGQKSASNAKDPLRPRRKKARRACFACQRAHLTCGDERPCERCIKRSLHDSCVDGVRKKAKYLHDAPDGALMPGVGASYHHLNGGHQMPLPGQHPAAVSMAQQDNYYTQAPSSTYYASHPPQGHMPPQDGPIMGHFNHQQAPISPPYSQSNPAITSNVPSSGSQGPPPQMQQFAGPLFDPSDPALFNFDISSLNFGNHYGALELGMLGHMSSGAAETPPSENNMMHPNQTPGMYNPQMSYSENQNLPAHISFGSNRIPGTEWQNAHSRQGSLQVQTPHNTPTTTHLDHNGHRHDSLNGPHAYTIGNGPSSLSSASPASTDVNSYDNDNPLSAASFFAQSNQQHIQQRSPTVNRPHQDNRSNTVLQPIHSNSLRKRRRDTRWIYEDINKPFDHVRSFHWFVVLLKKKCTSKESLKKVMKSLEKYRPVLMSTAADLDTNDLVHSERNLQRSLLTLKEHQAELATPSILCRRTGEVVAMNAEFTQLTGWTSDILLGKAPNMNANTGFGPEQQSESSTQTNTTPNMTGQEPDDGRRPVNIIELMDERSALEWLEDFSNLAYGDPRGTTSRRVNMIRYRTVEDVARIEEAGKGNMAPNGRTAKHEPTIKQEGRHLQDGEVSMNNVVSKDGLMDCMITWLIKRDGFDLPMLVSMQVMPVL